MKQTIFVEPTLHSLLGQELESWVGTPFRHKERSKGLGVDCINFILGVFNNVKVLDANGVALPDYSVDWMHHKKSMLLLDHFRQYDGLFAEINPRFKQDGDVALFKFNKSVCHCGIVFENYLYHALENEGVTKAIYGAWNSRHFTSFRRYVEV